MNVKINNKFSVESDSNQWKLIESYEGIDNKTKLTKIFNKTTYHGRLEQALNSALDKNCKEQQNICDILKSIDLFKSDISKMIKEYIK